MELANEIQQAMLTIFLSRSFVGKPQRIFPETRYKNAVTYQHFPHSNQNKVMQYQPVGPKVAVNQPMSSQDFFLITSDHTMAARVLVNRQSHNSYGA